MPASMIYALPLHPLLMGSLPRGMSTSGGHAC